MDSCAKLGVGIVDDLKITNPTLYRARALRAAFRKLGHDIKVDDLVFKMTTITKCPYCALEVNPLEWSIDHKIPKQRKGGTDDFDNLQLVCKTCNTIKGTLTDNQYKPLAVFLAYQPDIRHNLYGRLTVAGWGFRFRK